MKMKYNNTLPVVILDVKFAGYGMVRSLANKGISLIGFKPKSFIPESYSRHLEKIISFKNEVELLQQLKDLGAQYDCKPILWLTSDDYVTFAVKHRKTLDALFTLDLPAKATIDVLLDKTRFSEFAKEHDLLIPQTVNIDQHTNIEEAISGLTFPLILKPYCRAVNWRKANFPKAFKFENQQELFHQVGDILKIERQLLLQEWIPGKDENVVYCLVYYDKNNKCISYFTGSKIRQWPVNLGSTATTKPVKIKSIVNDAIHLFDQLKYQGFGSVEFKKHEKNQKYYIIEPTVGRPNQQEYAATINGVNIPLTAYQSLNNLPVEMVASKEPILYVDCLAEFKSAFKLIKSKQLTFKEWIKSLKGKKAYRYWSFDDSMVGIIWIIKLLEIIPKVVSRGPQLVVTRIRMLFM